MCPVLLTHPGRRSHDRHLSQPPLLRPARPPRSPDGRAGRSEPHADRRTGRRTDGARRCGVRPWHRGRASQRARALNHSARPQRLQRKTFLCSSPSSSPWASGASCSASSPSSLRARRRASWDSRSITTMPRRAYHGPASSVSARRRPGRARLLRAPGTLTSGVLPFVILFNALTDFGDLVAIAVPLVRRQGIDRAAWTSAAFALPAGSGMAHGPLSAALACEPAMVRAAAIPRGTVSVVLVRPLVHALFLAAEAPAAHIAELHAAADVTPEMLADVDARVSPAQLAASRGRRPRELPESRILRCASLLSPLRQAPLASSSTSAARRPPCATPSRSGAATCASWTMRFSSGLLT